MLATIAKAFHAACAESPIRPGIARVAARGPCRPHGLVQGAAPVVLVLLLLVFAPPLAQATDCNRATLDPITHVRLPGSPFTALPSADGCRIFVSLSSGTSGSGLAAGGGPGVAVLSRRDGVVTIERIVPLRGEPSGMALTHDGKLLIVPNGAGVAFLDVRRLEVGAPNAVLGYWGDDRDAPGHIYATVTADDRYLFVSNEAAGTISVIDLAAASRAHFSRDRVIRRIGIGSAPVGLALSADERYLFATVQEIKNFGWPLRCRPEADPNAAPDHAEGALVVIDAQRMISDPSRSVLKWVSAGCNPVRVVTSIEKGLVYVSARGSHALLAFAEAQLTKPGYDAMAAQVPVGTAPIGIAVIDGGRKVVVTNSDRFGNGATNMQSLFVIDFAGADTGAAHIVGVLPAKGFPREIRTTADSRTLLVTNFSAGTLEIIDLTRTPWVFSQTYAREQEKADPPLSAFSPGPLLAGGPSICNQAASRDLRPGLPLLATDASRHCID